jgi:hypothetical protein
MRYSYVHPRRKNLMTVAIGLGAGFVHSSTMHEERNVWWTAVAYHDTTWQEECRKMTPIVTTCDASRT